MTLNRWQKSWNAAMVMKRIGLCQTSLLSMVVKGQLNASIPLIRAVGVTDVPVISLAKRIEEVFVEGQSDSIILSHHSPELQLLQQIRDEAHRFAITYHRKLQGKRNLESVLDHIDGIGPKRRKYFMGSFQ